MTSADVARNMETDDKFYDWLNSKPQDAIVGDECMTLSCPLSRWLLDVCGVSVYIGNFWDCSTFQLTENESTVPMPLWAYRFASNLSDGGVGSVAVPVPPYSVYNYRDECGPNDLYAEPNGAGGYEHPVVYKVTAGGCLYLLKHIRATMDNYIEERANDLSHQGSYQPEDIEDRAENMALVSLYP